MTNKGYDNDNFLTHMQSLRKTHKLEEEYSKGYVIIFINIPIEI